MFHYRFQLEGPAALRDSQNRVLAFAAERGVPAVDMTPVLDSGLFLDFGHPSAEGRDRMAHALEQEVRRPSRGLFRGPPGQLDRRGHLERLSHLGQVERAL